jgi:type IV pilus assembly protein PilM
MIRNFLSTFLPEKIGSYYLLPKRVVGIDITKTNIYASQIYYEGNKVILEKFLTQHLDTGIVAINERIKAGIKTIFGQLSSFDEVRTSISSSSVIFKELTLPFLEREKIAAVLSYEIENALPFSLNDAVIDFIITKQDLQAKTATIMSAAIMKQYIAEHLSYFEGLVQPAVITVDLFDLYAVYKAIPEYQKQSKGAVLIDLGIQATRIAYLINGQLKMIRTIPKGLAYIAKLIGTQLNMSNGQALEEILRFGFAKNEDARYKETALKAFTDFWQETQFTLQSFIAQLGPDYTIDRVLLLGEGAGLTDIEQFIEQKLQVPCKLFDINLLLKNPIFNLKKDQARIDRSFTLSLSTALSELYQPEFNLRKLEFAVSAVQQFSKQFIATIALFIAIPMLLFLHNFLQTRKLQKAVRVMEVQAVSALRDRQLTDSRNLTEALKEAQAKVASEEELWFAFSRTTRFSFLKALQELSTTIDRKSLGLNLKKLIIAENTIGLEGEVKGFKELQILERELRESDLFINVPTLQDLKFNIRLPLKKNGGEAK